ncbi:MAG: DUF4350 domain-containing protein [Pseudomonadales bacterium]|nr:DUF4350 domain-containing protein [Pseudomonadales bacterium]
MRNKVLLSLVLFVLGACAWIVYTGVEFYEETVDQGWTVEAQRNPFLAAEKFLQVRGLQTASSSQLEKIDTLDQNTDFLFVENIGHIVSERQVSRILDWVEKGGYLIAGVALDEGAENHMLETLGVSVYETDYQCDCERSDLEEAIEAFSTDDDMTDEKDGNKKQRKSVSDFMRQQNELIKARAGEQQDEQEQLEGKRVSEKEERDKAINEREITLVYFEGDEMRLKLHFDPYSALFHPVFDEPASAVPSENTEDAGQTEEMESRETSVQNDAVSGEQDSSMVHSLTPNATADEAYRYQPSSWGGSEAGVHYLQFGIGRGHIMLLSDSSVFTSRRIIELDHAYFLGRAAPDKGSALFLYGAFMPAFYVLMFRYFPECCLLLLLSLGCFVLCKSQRFGVIVKPETGIRRSLAEHLDMRGRHRWRTGDKKGFFSPVQKDIEKRLLLKHPLVTEMDVQQRYAFLAALTRLPAHRVSHLMSMSDVANTQEFTQAIIDLQHIRNTL